MSIGETYMRRDYRDVARELLKDYRIIIFIATIVLSLIFIAPVPVMEEDGTYTIKTDIKKGIDLEGGVTAIILPEEPTKENAQKIVEILLNRISSFGLKEAKANIINVDDRYLIDLSIAGADERDLRELIEKQGVFEAYIERKALRVKDNTYEFKLASKTYSLKLINNTTVLFNNTFIKLNESFYIGEFKIVPKDVLDDEIVLWIQTLKGDEINTVLIGAGYSSIIETDGIYRFTFTITISQEAAERFKILTDDMSIVGQSLNEFIVFVLDGNVTDVLSIDVGLKGVVTTNIQISGTGSTREEAEENMKRMRAILQSGSLPTKVKILEINEISPILGKDFLRVAIYSILAALIFVGVVIGIIYRDVRVVIPMFLTSITEVLSILGFASLVGWTIDLAAIAGIVAAIGTGIDDQIVVIDESKKRGVKESLRVKLKRAFFVIFTTASTTIVAMLPLLMSNFANVKGFAFTTIIGVLIGVFITRPAFARVIKILLE